MSFVSFIITFPHFLRAGVDVVMTKWVFVRVKVVAA